MGADFCFVLNEIQVSKEEARRNAERLVAAKRDEVATILSDDCMVLEMGDAVENITDESILKCLYGAIDEVYDCGNRRDCGVFYVDGTRPFHITGGISWGDEPSDAWDSFYIVARLGLSLVTPNLLQLSN